MLDIIDETHQNDFTELAVPFTRLDGGAVVRMKWLNAGKSKLMRLQEGDFPLNRDFVTNGDLLAGLA